MGVLFRAVFAFLALLGLVSGETQQATLPPEQSIVSKWPTDMVLRIGQEGRMNFTLKPGARFTLLSMKAIFIGTTSLATIYQATTTSAVVQPDFVDTVEKIEGSDHDLKIKSMGWTGAGTYEAGVTHTDLIQETMPFAVVAIDQAKCSVSKTEDVEVGDVVSMDCSSEYTGSKAPMMQWKDADGKEILGSVIPTDDDDGTTPSPTAPKKVLYSANITASHKHHRRLFTCSLFFAEPITYTDSCITSFGLKGEDSDTIVSKWPTDMAVRVGKEGRVNFTLLPGKGFTLLSLKAVFVGTSELQTIYQATESSAVVQPDFEDMVEKVPDSPHDLVAKEMPWSGAGHYLAQVIHSDLNREERIFKMVVVNQVQCSLSKSEDIKEGDVVSMDCSAEYTGDKTPMMKWQNENGKDIQGFVVNTPDYSYEKTLLTTIKKVVYRANVPVSCDCPRRLFKCRLSFEDPITYTDSCNTWFGVE